MLVLRDTERSHQQFPYFQMQNDDNFDDMEIVHIIVDFNLDSLVVTLHFFFWAQKM